MMTREHSMNQVFVNKLTEVLKVNLENEHFGVKELAKAMGVSRSQLHRKIHTINNSSTSQFIREFRLKKAMAMLQDNVATASEIAYRVGFSSPSYFNTCFREYYGYPPGEVKYRNPLTAEDKENIPTAEQASTKHKPTEKAITEKVSFNKGWVLFFSLGVAIALSIFYFLYFKTDDTQVLEPVGTITNEAVEKSIAVLPIKNWSGDSELEYIGDGMTDAVIARLAMIDSMTKVIPFTSIIKYKTSDKSVPAIAEELGVRHILQGNFQLSGDQMKIALYLLDGPWNKHSWSYEYAGEWNSNAIFKVQAEIAENVARKMNVEIRDSELEAIQFAPTDSKEAYNLWLQANYQQRKRTKNGWQNAVTLYEKAIAIDTSFIAAYFALASSYQMGGVNWGIYKEKVAWRKVKDLMRTVKQLDSSNLWTESVLLNGSYLYEWNFAGMEEDYLNSIYAIPYTLQTGRYEETLTLINQDIDKNPTWGFRHAWKALTLFFLNRKEEAIAYLQQNDQLYNDHIDYLRETSRCYYYLGEFENSKVLLVNLMNKFTDRPPTILWLNALHASRDGRKDDLNNNLNELHFRYKAGASGSPAWFLALYYAMQGNQEKVFEWLQRSYDRHEVEIIWLREEPSLIPFRNDQRYIDLYTKVGFPMAPHSTPD